MLPERGPEQPGDWPRLQRGAGRVPSGPGSLGAALPPAPHDEHAHLHGGLTYARAMQPSDQNQTFKAPINEIQTCPQARQPLVSLPSGDLSLGWHLTLLSSRRRTGRHQGSAWNLGPRIPGEVVQPELSLKNQDPQCESRSRRKGVTTRVPRGPCRTHLSPTALETLVAVVCTQAGSSRPPALGLPALPSMG